MCFFYVKEPSIIDHFRAIEFIYVTYVKHNIKNTVNNLLCLIAFPMFLFYNKNKYDFVPDTVQIIKVFPSSRHAGTIVMVINSQSMPEKLLKY